jgi:hypothetical protein
MSYNRLLQPKINPFGLIIYFPKEGTITLKTFSDQIISSAELYKYKEQGTYCNSFNELFISEGRDFWIINNTTFSIIKKKTPLDKKNHTMIFLSFLIGCSKVFLGGADKKSFYYDLKKNYFINWAEANEVHNKPSLIRICDYLYLFDNLKQSKSCFETTKLSDIDKKWKKKIYFSKNYLHILLDDAKVVGIIIIILEIFYFRCILEIFFNFNGKKSSR